uniref:Uncharacterized protein n=1 Tax=viral metagenome TaxID=1070528 RepID=A0A2V0RJW0_9ZZZZ
MSNSALDRKYRMMNGVAFDTNLRDVGEAITRMLRDYGITHVSLKRDNVVEGRSWEMGAAKSLLGIEDTSTGTVLLYEPNERVTFGPVLGIPTKRYMITNLEDSDTTPYIALSR